MHLKMQRISRICHMTHICAIRQSLATIRLRPCPTKNNLWIFVKFVFEKSDASLVQVIDYRARTSETSMSTIANLFEYCRAWARSMKLTFGTTVQMRAELSSLKLCRMQPVVTNEIRNLKPAVRQPLPSFYPPSRLLLGCFYPASRLTLD